MGELLKFPPFSIAREHHLEPLPRSRPRFSMNSRGFYGSEITHTRTSSLNIGGGERPCGRSGACQHRRSRTRTSPTTASLPILGGCGIRCESLYPLEVISTHTLRGAGGRNVANNVRLPSALIPTRGKLQDIVLSRFEPGEVQ